VDSIAEACEILLFGALTCSYRVSAWRQFQANAIGLGFVSCGPTFHSKPWPALFKL
jgi:hypothetical protein